MNDESERAILPPTGSIRRSERAVRAAEQRSGRILHFTESDLIPKVNEVRSKLPIN